MPSLQRRGLQLPLRGHSKRLMYVDWHPLANNVLVAATADEVKLWDVESGSVRLL